MSGSNNSVEDSVIIMIVVFSTLAAFVAWMCVRYCRYLDSEYRNRRDRQRIQNRVIGFRRDEYNRARMQANLAFVLVQAEPVMFPDSLEVDEEIPWVAPPPWVPPPPPPLPPPPPPPPPPPVVHEFFPFTTNGLAAFLIPRAG